MKHLVFTIVASLAVSAVPHAARAAVALAAIDSYMQIKPVKQLALDDGRKAYIGSDHKLYLLDAAGKGVPAPAGHYMLAGGACVNVGADSAVDPASFARLTGHVGQGKNAL